MAGSTKILRVLFGHEKKVSIQVLVDHGAFWGWNFWVSPSLAASFKKCLPDSKPMAPMKPGWSRGASHGMATRFTST